MIGFTPSIGLVTKLCGARKLVDRRRTSETFYNFYIYIYTCWLSLIPCMRLKWNRSWGKIDCLYLVVGCDKCESMFLCGYSFRLWLVWATDLVKDDRITFIRVTICIIVDPLLRLRLLSSFCTINRIEVTLFVTFSTIKSFFRFYPVLF